MMRHVSVLCIVGMCGQYIVNEYIFPWMESSTKVNELDMTIGMFKTKFGKEIPEDDLEIIYGSQTEIPYENKYNYFNEEGIYISRVFKTPLFSSKYKMKSDDGYPMFSEVISKEYI